jgi:uncharacterized protein (UPF0261 family)
MRGKAYVVGTWDTKAPELAYLAECLQRSGVGVVTVDVGTSGGATPQTDFTARDVARFHPDGPDAALGLNDRGAAVSAMSIALAAFLPPCRDLGGVIAAGGSGNTALVAPAFRALPIGTPKVIVSTVASGNVAPYVGASDIAMMYSVTDVQGLNRISRRVLANGAHALAGMILNDPPASIAADKPAIGLTMFGVTTPCIQAVMAQLADRFDCLVFHATGTGGQSMEKLADSGLLSGLIDATTTEIPDFLFGGVFAATADRLGAVARTRLPYVSSCGALDMVNFGALATVPAQFRNRRLHVHNANVTLMRTTPDENRQVGEWLAARLNQCEGQVRFLIPAGGLSLLDVPGEPFHDPEADGALFDAITANFNQTESRKLIQLPAAINDPSFASALVEAFCDARKHAHAAH